MSASQNQEHGNFHGFQVLQPMRVLPQPSPNLRLYEPLNFQNCAQVFTFPQQGNLQWCPLSFSQDLSTPTNLPATISNLGAICSATPEFVHPRNSNAPQWLMSPPVEEVYPHTPPTPMNPRNTSTLTSAVTLNPPDPTLTSAVTLNPPDPTLTPAATSNVTLTPAEDTRVKLLPPDYFTLEKSLSHDDVIVTSQSTFVDARVTSQSLPTMTSQSSDLNNSADSDAISTTSSPNDSAESNDDSGINSPASSPPDGSRGRSEVVFLERRIREFLSRELSRLVRKLVGSPLPPGDSFPIGVFWDIENCAVPVGKSAAHIVAKVRRSFFQGHKEVEFMAVCDINKETRRVVQDLNDSQVSVVHVNARSKNAADEKLRQSIRRFAQTYNAPATVVLITGDCDFMAEISDLRHRNNLFVVLVHPCRTRSLMRDAANTAVKFEDFVREIPITYPVKELNSESQLLVSNLPLGVAPNSVLDRLSKVTAPFHGTVTRVTLPTAAIRFPSDDLARRGMRRLQGSEVIGSIVTVQRRSSDLSALSKHFTPRSNKSESEIHSNQPENFQHRSKKTEDKNVHVTISNIDAQLGVKNIQQKIVQIISKYSPILKLQIRPHNRFTVVCDVIVPSIDRASAVLQQLHRTRIGNKRILLTIAQDTSCHGDVTSTNRSVCPQHFPPTNRSWRKRGGLLKIEIGLREFSAKLHALLHTHDGAVYIEGFEHCYSAEFGGFPYPVSSDDGVYFHHQVSYVPGVQIIEDKVIVWTQPTSDTYSDTASEASSSSRSKSSNLVSFSREVVNFLKRFPYCAVPFSDFKSSFATQCRGFCAETTETLSSIPHVVQIIGSNGDRVVTLTHRAQVKRFVLEITKILKTSPDRAILVAQLPGMYFKCFNRPWKLRDYGVSVLTDILDDIPEGNILVSGGGDNIVLSLPTRVRTAEEVGHTEAFSLEVVEILRSRPRHRISFTDFVPSYHRHFGRQCKLSKYGFAKLLDLFEALSAVVEVVEVGGEKYLRLCESEQIKVLSSQVVALLRHHMATVDDGKPPQGVPLSRLQPLFSRKFGFPLVPKYFDCSDIEQLVSKLSHVVKSDTDSSGETYLQLTDKRPVRLLSAQLLVLLLDSEVRKINIRTLHLRYRERYGEDIVPHDYGFLGLCDVIKRALAGIAKFSESSEDNCLSLRPIYLQARRVRSILLLHGGAMTLGEFNQAYKAAHGEALNPEKLGFRSNEGFLRALTLVLVVKGFGIKKTIVLRNHMKHGPLSRSIKDEEKSPEGKSPEGKPPPLQEIINNASPPKPKPMKGPGESRGLFPQCEDKLQTPPIFPNFGTNYADSYHRYQSAIAPYLDTKDQTSKDQTTNHPFQPFDCDMRRCRSQPESFYQQNTIHDHSDTKHQLGHHPSLEVLPKPAEMVQNNQTGNGLLAKHQQIGPNQHINGSFQQNGSTYHPQGGYNQKHHPKNGEDPQNGPYHPQNGPYHPQIGVDPQKGPYRPQNGPYHPQNGPYHPQSGVDPQKGPLHQRRKISVSVITLPNGTTSLSSNSSPDSFLSTDEDLKSSPETQQDSPLRLAAAFSTVSLVPP